MKKTNAMRLLEQKEIPYETRDYLWDEENLDAVHIAHENGLNPENLFKTIVLKDSENRISVFCLSSLSTISMKKVRSILKVKKVDLLPTKDLLKTTGYIRGGCSPIGMIRSFPTYIEEIAQLMDTVYVSAGVKGTQLILTPENLQAATDGVWADFT